MAEYEYSIVYDFDDDASSSMWASTGTIGHTFTANEDFQVYGFRGKFPSTGTYTFKLWDASDQSVITELPCNIESVNTWCDFFLEDPVKITEGKTYAITTYGPRLPAFGSGYSGTVNEKISMGSSLYISGADQYPTETSTFKPMCLLIMGEVETHTHNYTETVTTAATCTTAGVKTFTCECGDSYTEAIPATGHSYSSGVCTVCGAADPDYENAGSDSNHCFYNGVRLPAIPSDVLAKYPYCWIRKNDNTQHYDLLLTKILGYYDTSLGGIAYGTTGGTTDVVHYRLAYSGASSADGWDNYQTTNTWMALDVNRTIMWSNHYIPNGSLTATEMYFKASEAIPDVAAYRIERETVVGIADQVRRLCNTEATMTPAQMESNLGGLNIELMETYVISTEEEQVIYPDEGYYGFSKITVGAVDLSGGTGSGGTGGDTTTIPDASTGSFGNVTANGETESQFTGNYIYNGHPTPLPPLPDDYPCKLIYYEDGYAAPYYALLCSVPMVKKGESLCTPDVAQNGNVSNDYVKVVRYNCLSGNTVWADRSESAAYGCDADKVIWANYDIVEYGTAEDFMCGSNPMPEKNEGVGTMPSETEDSYIVSGDDMNRLGAVAQSMTGTETTMTWEEILAALESVK